MSFCQNVYPKGYAMIRYARAFGGTMVLASFFMIGMMSMSFAQTSSDPKQMLQNTVDEIVDTINQDDPFIASKKNIYELVKKKLLPLFNNRRITARAIGRSWLLATDAQKASLMSSFTDIVMLTYTNALTSSSKSIHTFSIRWGRSEVSHKRAIIRSMLHTEKGTHKIDYILRKRKNNWKIDDILIANFSIFSVYRDQFSAIIKSEGIPGLVNKLQEEQAALAIE